MTISKSRTSRNLAFVLTAAALVFTASTAPVSAMQAVGSTFIAKAADAGTRSGVLKNASARSVPTKVQRSFKIARKVVRKVK